MPADLPQSADPGGGLTGSAQPVRPVTAPTPSADLVGHPETTCPECHYDAADPKGWAYLGKRGPYCGRSNWKQPMYACRFGKPAFDAAYDESGALRVPPNGRSVTP